MSFGKLGAMGRGFGHLGALGRASGGGGSTQTLHLGDSLYSRGSFSAFVGGTASTSTVVVNTASFPNGGTVVNQVGPGSGTSVVGFLQFASYGNYFWTVPQTPITAAPINGIDTLDIAFNYTHSGTADGHNVIIDWFTCQTSTNTQNSDHLHEFLVFLSASTPAKNYFAGLSGGTIVSMGSTTIGGVSWDVAIDTQPSIPIVMFIPTSRTDVLSGTFSAKQAMDFAVAAGKVGTVEYYTGHAIGVEIIKGTATLNAASTGWSVTYALSAIQPLDFFAANLSQNAWTPIIATTAMQYYNGATYGAFTGTKFDVNAFKYTHSTQTFDGPYRLQSGISAQDAHEECSVIVDKVIAPGTMHIFGNCHVTPMQYFKTTTPGDLTTLTQQTNPVSSASYCTSFQTADGKLWVFYRSGDHTSAWNYITSTDNGATWAAPVTFLNYGLAANDAAYLNVWKDSSDNFHVTWNWEDEGNSLGNPRGSSNIFIRYNVYYMKLRASDSTWRKIDGTAVGTFPPTLTSSQSELKLVDTQTGLFCTQIPICRTDSGGNPFILWIQQTNITTGIPHDFKFGYWNGSSFVVNTIATCDHLFDDYDFEYVSGTGSGASFRAYLATGGSSGTDGDWGTYLDRGGNIEEWSVTSGGASSSKTQTIATAPSTSALYNSPMLIKDYASPIKLAYAEWTNSNTVFDRKGYLWGSRGKVLTPIEPEMKAVFNRMSVTPSTVDQSRLNAVMRGLKAIGLYANLDAFYMFDTADKQSALLSWVSSANDMLEGGTGTFTPYVGWAGNGTTGYLDTRLSINSGSGSKFSQNDALLGVWMNTNIAPAANDMGSVVGNNHVFLTPHDTGAKVNFRLNQSTSVNDTSYPDGRRLTMLARNSSTNVKLFKNNNAPISKTTIATIAPNDPTTITLGKVNGTAQFSANQWSNLLIGKLGTLTDAQLQFLYFILFTYKRQTGLY